LRREAHGKIGHTRTVGATRMSGRSKAAFVPPVRSLA
jgi:hypothetical protein